MFDGLHGATLPTSFTLNFARNVLRGSIDRTGTAGAVVRMDTDGHRPESAEVASVPGSAWRRRTSSGSCPHRAVTA